MSFAASSATNAKTIIKHCRTTMRMDRSPTGRSTLFAVCELTSVGRFRRNLGALPSHGRHPGNRVCRGSRHQPKAAAEPRRGIRFPSAQHRYGPPRRSMAGIDVCRKFNQSQHGPARPLSFRARVLGGRKIDVCPEPDLRGIQAHDEKWRRFRVTKRRLRSCAAIPNRIAEYFLGPRATALKPNSRKSPFCRHRLAIVAMSLHMSSCLMKSQNAP